MNSIRIRIAAVSGALFVATPGCTWVPLTDEGGEVRVLARAAPECRYLASISSKTADRVSIFARSERKVREELETLARNEAARSGGNAIVPMGEPANGRQSFGVYRCPDG